MESSELRDLLEFLAKSNFVEFEMEREGFRLRLLRANAPAPGAAPNGASPAQVDTQATQALAPTSAPPAEHAGPDGGRLLIVTSPIVGTFFRAAAPDAPPFVEVGDRVKNGQVLCIVEAMKLMNEIESEVEGEILEVLVANGQPVEYGEVLFKIRPIG